MRSRGSRRSVIGGIVPVPSEDNNGPSSREEE